MRQQMIKNDVPYYVFCKNMVATVEKDNGDLKKDVGSSNDIGLVLLNILFRLIGKMKSEETETLSGVKEYWSIETNGLKQYIKDDLG